VTGSGRGTTLQRLRDLVDEDVWWRLTHVVGNLTAWPHLTDPLLNAVERAMWRVPERSHEVNSKGEIDALLEQLCRRVELRCGISGARLDDLLFQWLSLPESMNPNCPPKFQFLNLVSRVTSSLVVPGRWGGDPGGLLDRLEAWIAHWRDAGEKSDKARFLVSLARTYPLR
jgi:hypothetical protein